MVSTEETYEKSENILKGCLILAFLGVWNAGHSSKGVFSVGSDSEDKLREISGKKAKRIKQLESLFRKTKIFIRVFVGGCGNRKLK